MRIAVFGAGYVGLVTGVCFAEMGNTVHCVDIDSEKVNSLKSGRSPIYETGLETLLKRNLESGRLHFHSDGHGIVEKVDILFVAVDTPAMSNGSADLSAVLDVAKLIGEEMTSYKVVVIKSTVPVGTWKAVRDKIQEQLHERSIQVEFDLCSNPEFLREGVAVEDCLKPSRVILGLTSARCETAMKNLYGPFLRNGRPCLVMDPASAEMVKYSANAMLAARISLMNEFSRVCEKVGADIEQVRLGMGSDPRIGGEFIYAGLGYGGNCLPKDLQSLKRMGQDVGEDLEILASVERVNKTQRDRFLNKIEKYFSGDLKGKKIAVWGLAFKPGTDDVREAPGVYLVQRLAAAGARVTVTDPAAMKSAKAILGTSAEFFSSPYQALEQADALVVVTEWLSFREPDFEKIKSEMKRPVIFDGRNIYSPARMKELGFVYHGVGRSL